MEHWYILKIKKNSSKTIKYKTILKQIKEIWKFGITVFNNCDRELEKLEIPQKVIRGGKESIIIKIYEKKNRTN